MEHVLTLSIMILLALGVIMLIRKHWAKIVAAAGLTSLVIAAVYTWYWHGGWLAENGETLYAFIYALVDEFTHWLHLA